MSKREEKIAKRLGWKVTQDSGGFYLKNGDRLEIQSMWDTAAEAWYFQCPRYLTDRNAAQEVVAHFAKTEPQWLKFHIALNETLFGETYGGLGFGPPHSHQTTQAFLLATPRQIADAACKVWGIE